MHTLVDNRQHHLTLMHNAELTQLKTQRLFIGQFIHSRSQGAMHRNCRSNHPPCEMLVLIDVHGFNKSSCALVPPLRCKSLSSEISVPSLSPTQARQEI